MLRQFQTMRAVGAAALLAWATVGCANSSAQSATKKVGPGDVAATVGTRAISYGEVDELALQQSASSFGSMKLSQALYEARRNAIEQLVSNQLIDDEAKARGVDKSTLLQQEVSAKVKPVTDADVMAWYGANQARVQGATLDQVRAPIRSLLTQERSGDAREAFIDALKAKTPVIVRLEVPRLTVADAGRPATGPANAPIQIVEFSDFQCPFCSRATPTVKRVMETYGDKIRLVYRHYPLPNHPNARPAAEASQCAADQNKFWPFHDRLFADQSKLSVDDLKKSAGALGLDAAAFNACVDSHKFAAAVEEDIKAGGELGVDGTPAFFINGRMVVGAQPFEAFKRVIDEELQKK